ncbi:MAG: hypothetical protein J5I93_13580 [Pirellulaceae bacterium]|nr:hypothetical protein [Pirellulaceae bacterium]
MSESGSISKILVDIKQGDERAAEQLWNRLVGAVAARARKQLATYGVRGADQEDIAIDVFASLCRGAVKGRFPRLDDRGDLWQILMMLTRQKVIDRKRKRPPEWTESAIGRVDNDGSELLGLDIVPAQELPADIIVTAVDSLRELLDSMDESQRQVALLRMDGLNNQEIAARLKVSLRSVERKATLIRQDWQRRLDHDSGK